MSFALNMCMNPTIGLIGKNTKNFQDIRSSLDSSLRLDVLPFHHASVFARATQTVRFHAMVMILEYFGNDQVRLLEKIEAQFPQAPVVIMADEVDAIALMKVKGFHKKTVLHTETEKKDLLGILLRMTKTMDSGIYYRSHRRNRTMQFAQVVDQKQFDQTEINARILDLSKGGAQLQVFTGSYQIGDHIHIRIPLTQLQRVHVLKAKVVWTKEDNTHSVFQKPTQRLGLSFSA